MQLWEAVSELRASGKWGMAHIPRLHREHEARLAEGQAHELPGLDIPAQPACALPDLSRAEVSALPLRASMLTTHGFTGCPWHPVLRPPAFCMHLNPQLICATG